MRIAGEGAGGGDLLPCPVRLFFASQGVSRDFCRLDTESTIFTSAPLPGHGRGVNCAGKFVCTCLFKTMKSSIAAEELITGFGQNWCRRT